MEKKILLVEDDLNMGFLLVNYLQDENFKVKLCRDGFEGLTVAQNEHFDLCLLDVMMPKLDGFALAKALRKKGVTTPFIFLTAKSMKEDKLNGYSVGAEDYITKPFDEDELLCKINVILRREKTEKPECGVKHFTIGKFQFDYNLHELIFESEVHRMTKKENEVLKLLCMQKNNILKRDDAVQHIYGQNDYFMGRCFDVYISRIRKLLKKDPSIEIKNVFNVGFILSDKSDVKVSSQKPTV